MQMTVYLIPNNQKAEDLLIKYGSQAQLVATEEASWLVFTPRNQLPFKVKVSTGNFYVSEDDNFDWISSTTQRTFQFNEPEYLDRLALLVDDPSILVHEDILSLPQTPYWPE